MLLALVSVFGVIATAPTDSIWNQNVAFEVIIEHNIYSWHVPLGTVGRITVDIMDYPSLLALYRPVSDIEGVEIFFSPERTNNATNEGQFVFAFLAPVGAPVPTADNFLFVPTPGGISSEDIIMYGDVDGDWIVTFDDAMLVYEFSMAGTPQFTPKQLLSADVLGPHWGGIDIFGALAIYDYAIHDVPLPITSM